MSEIITFDDPNATQIQIVNDIYKGIDTAKTHIIKFTKEDQTEFTARQNAATIDNYVNTTVDTSKNIIFRKPIDLTGITNSEVLSWCDKIDFTNNINEFAKDTLVNRIRDGHAYILVDSNVLTNEVKTKADQLKQGIRPYFVNLLRSNVQPIAYNEFGELSIVAVREFEEVKVGKFGKEIIEKIKVFYEGGLVEIYDKDSNFISSMQTAAKKVPLVKIGSDNIPPLYDQAKLNIQHINRSSECSNYVRVGAAPFPIVYGQLEDSAGAKTLAINTGLHFSNKTESGFEWAEMTGQNYEIIEKHITKLEQQMERISIEFATEIKSQTATQVEKGSMSNESKLNDYASELEDGINLALEFMQFYKTSSLGENLVLVNKDFESNVMTMEAFNMLMQLRMNGDISYDRLMKTIERGEVLAMLEDKERETEKLLLRNEGNLS